ncbi:MAG: hypothetical protein H6643_05855 [Caldilineaceae bacterium]|nr:hypothetical protein [Caldilineaceae bacterium]
MAGVGVGSSTATLSVAAGCVSAGAAVVAVASPAPAVESAVTADGGASRGGWAGVHAASNMAKNRSDA